METKHKVLICAILALALAVLVLIMATKVDRTAYGYGPVIGAAIGLGAGIPQTPDGASPTMEPTPTHHPWFKSPATPDTFRMPTRPWLIPHYYEPQGAL
jgi:hypothetical protein